MALTRKGNRTGRAASTELREQREWLREEQTKYRKEFEWKYGEAMDQLRALDPDWSRWYDDRPEQTSDAMYPVILERIEELKLNSMQAEGYEIPMQIRSSLGL